LATGNPKYTILTQETQTTRQFFINAYRYNVYYDVCGNDDNNGVCNSDFESDVGKWIMIRG